jgi:hypothetical protein
VKPLMIAAEENMMRRSVTIVENYGKVSHVVEGINALGQLTYAQARIIHALC